MFFFNPNVFSFLILHIIKIVTDISFPQKNEKTFFFGEHDDPFSTSTFQPKPETSKELSPSSPDTSGGDWNTDNWDNWESSTAPKSMSILFQPNIFSSNNWINFQNYC